MVPLARETELRFPNWTRFKILFLAEALDRRLYGYYLQETVQAPRVAAPGTVTVTMLHGPGEK
jgi:hypothetical protein